MSAPKTVNYTEFIGTTKQQYYKILREDLTSYGSFTYKVGKNEEKQVIGSNGVVKPWEGLSFTNLCGLIQTCHYGNKIALIELDQDAEFKIEGTNKFKTNHFTITSIISFVEFINAIENDVFIEKLLAFHPCYYAFMNQDAKPQFAFNIVQKDGMNIKYIKNIDPSISTIAVQQNPEALKYLSNQTNILCMTAIKKNYTTIQYVTNQTIELCKYAIDCNVDAIQYIKKVTKELYLYAMNKKKFSLAHLEKRNKNKSLCLAAVMTNGLDLQFVEEQDLESCMAAVTQNGLALEFVKPEFKTNEVCGTAISENNIAIKFVDNYIFATQDFTQTSSTKQVTKNAPDTHVDTTQYVQHQPMQKQSAFDFFSKFGKTQ